MATRTTPVTPPSSSSLASTPTLTAHQHLFDKTSAVKCGLFCGTQHTPLSFLSAVVNAHVVHGTAKASMTLVFRNDGPRAVTSHFVLPVPKGWAVQGFEAQFPKSVHSGRLVKRLQSHKEFREGVFCAAFTESLRQGESATFTINLLIPLQGKPGSKTEWVLHWPASAFPSGEADPKAHSDWDNMFKLCAVAPTQRRISLTLTCDMFDPIDSVACVSHKMAFNVNGKTAKGTLELSFEGDAPVKLSEDLNIKMVTSNTQEFLQVRLVKEKGSSLKTKSAETFAMLLSIVPQLDKYLATPNVELIFLVDCSGSMQKWMNSVERTLKLCLQGLPKTARFNICLFGADTTFMDEAGCLEYNHDNLLWGRAFIHDLQANKGGTNLYGAVKRAYEIPIARGYYRHLVALTDGTPNKFYDFTRLVHQNAITTKFSVFACGSSVNDRESTKHLTDLARGKTISIDAPSAVTGAFMTSLPSLLVPALSNVVLSFHYEGNADRVQDDETVIPPIRTCVDKIPILSHREHNDVYGFASGDLASNPVIRLLGWVGANVLEYNYHMGDLSSAKVNFNDDGKAESISVMHSAASASRIQYISEYRDSPKLSHGHADEMFRLSTGFQLQCPLTCWVLQEENEDLPTDRSVDYHREIASEFAYTLPRHESEVQAIPVPKPRVAEGRADYRLPPNPDAVPTAPKNAPTTRDFIRSIVSEIVRSICDAPALDDIVFLQTAAGFWRLNEALARGMEFEYSHLQESVPYHTLDGIPFEIPAVKEREQRAERERLALEQEDAAVARKEEEIQHKKARAKLEKQRRTAERGRGGEEGEEDDTERRKAEEADEKRRQAIERQERERKEKEREAERARKNKEANRKRMVKKYGEDAVRKQEEAEARQKQEEILRQQREEEAAVQREMDCRLRWAQKQRKKYIGDIWATSMAISYLRLVFGAKVHEFDFAVQRALAWLRDTGIAAVQQWPNQTSSLLRQELAQREHVRQMEKQAYEQALEEEDRMEQERIAAETWREREQQEYLAREADRRKTEAARARVLDDETSEEETEESRRANARLEMQKWEAERQRQAELEAAAAAQEVAEEVLEEAGEGEGEEEPAEEVEEEVGDEAPPEEGEGEDIPEEEGVEDEIDEEED